MSDDLKLMLERNQVADEVLARMVANKCTTIESFANWVDDKKELKAHFIDNQHLGDDEAAQTSRLKMAWRQADAWVAKKLKRTSEGMTEEPLDDPLEEGLQTSVIDSFKRAWSWAELPPERMGADTLLGRVYREFQARKPTIYPVAKVRSLVFVNALHCGPKKQRVSEKLSMIIEGQEDDTPDLIGTLVHYFTAHEVLANTWVVAGTNEVENEGKKTRFASWPEIYEYRIHVKDEACEMLATHTEASVILYVTAVEEFFRLKAMHAVRSNPKVCWGTALVAATKEYANTWDHKKDLLVSRSSQGHRAIELKPGPVQPRKGGGKGKDKQNQIRVKKEDFSDVEYKKWWTTTAYDHKNNMICKPYNDQRGCKGKCPNGHLHICDVVLESGKYCLSRAHNRWGHKVKEHGAPQKR